ncbi:hypothetical protein HJG60_010440 [Phyllostomus discolor]|uniref:Uncharacterized protein n=1 Tax=Phyllostomus discolor TaxID=89673 RepID=A0A834ARW0_9CHIR|nr:hypothetical protein HJG60_010440 [Phyllostomus discolor]
MHGVALWADTELPRLCPCLRVGWLELRSREADGKGLPPLSSSLTPLPPSLSRAHREPNGHLQKHTHQRFFQKAPRDARDPCVFPKTHRGSYAVKAIPRPVRSPGYVSTAAGFFAFCLLASPAFPQGGTAPCPLSYLLEALVSCLAPSDPSVRICELILLNPPAQVQVPATSSPPPPGHKPNSPLCLPPDFEPGI